MSAALPFVEMAVVDLATVKTCSCGREFDRSSWDIAPLVGYVGAASGDDSQVLELRNCRSCGSTMALEIPASERES